MSLPTIEDLLLDASGLVYPASSGPEVEYLFQHTLVQEALYDSLLRTDRQRLHQAAGEALERLGDQGEAAASAAVLAYHFDRAGNTERAVHYHTLAGDAALQVYALPEAARHYDRAIAVGGASIDSQSLQHIYLNRGRALELSGNYPEALANYQALEGIGRQRHAGELELAALLAAATLHATPTPLRDEQKVQALSMRALELARRVEDHAAEAKILWNLMLVVTTAGQAEAGVQYGEQSLEIARRYQLREQMAFTLNDMQFCLMGTGQFSRAVGGLEEAQTIWRELGNRPMQADNLARLGLTYLLTGRYEQSLSASADSYQISRSIGNLWGMSFSLMFVGQIYQYRGQLGRAVETNHEVIELGERGGSMAPQVSTRAELAWMYALQGDLDTAEELGRQALQAAQRYIPAWETLVEVYQARIAARRGELERARAMVDRIEAMEAQENAYARLQLTYALPLAAIDCRLACAEVGAALESAERALKIAENGGIKPYAAEIQILQARALFELGRDEQAEAALQEALAEIDRMGANELRWRALDLQARIEARSGRPEQAAWLRQRVRSLVLQIAGQCLPRLSETYLAQAEIQAALRD